MGLQKDTESIQRARFDDCGEVIVGSYSSWLTKYPSALDNFDEMMKLAEGKKVVVFLDYDGTLSKIVKDPDKATMTQNMREAVKNVALHFPTAVISGRGRDKVLEFVQLDEVYYAGSHGMDISTPSGSSKYGSDIHQTITINEKGEEVVDFCPAKEFLPTIQEIVIMLRDKTKHIKGAIVEDNKFCLSVHFRCVEDKDVGDLKSMVEDMMQGYPNFKISEGKKVMEIRPNIEWDKGRALLYLLDTLGFGNSNDVLPIYIGDDKTDEDAFKVIQSRGEDQGLAIVVSSTPKETEASYSLREPNQVKSFLKRLVKWKQDLQPSI
ncbi:trehalose-phosphate phosphatase B-like [Ziziphus jujuba]|uniref:Trehalose 6-phosphate phosphatase n=1 Tax=Ziziphus jujuba TaxID=326968 RepID=A0A6P4A5G3_ZIZJJ|nr:trehalose-phosphate phosphatase B-like [Ziziphus jujuba]